MADDNLPGAEPGPVDAPATFDEQVAGISELLGNPETDQSAEVEETDAAEPEQAAPERDILDEVVAEDADNHDDDDTGSGPGDPKGGQFAPDSAKVNLGNGRTISVRELKTYAETREREMQRGFTEKQQALAAERKQVTEYAQSLAQARDFVAWAMEQYGPKQPEPFEGNPMENPAAWIDHQQKMEAWNRHVQAYQSFQQHQQSEAGQKQAETQKQARERIAREASELVKVFPVLKDQGKAKQFWAALETGAAEHYGIPPELTRTVVDHRMVRVLRDALELRKIKSSASQVQKDIGSKPPPVGRRPAPDASAMKARKERSERLRNSGDFDLGVAALKDLIS